MNPPKWYNIAKFSLENESRRGGAVKGSRFAHEKNPKKKRDQVGKPPGDMGDLHRIDVREKHARVTPAEDPVEMNSATRQLNEVKRKNAARHLAVPKHARAPWYQRMRWPKGEGRPREPGPGSADLPQHTTPHSTPEEASGSASPGIDAPKKPEKGHRPGEKEAAPEKQDWQSFGPLPEKGQTLPSKGPAKSAPEFSGEGGASKRSTDSRRTPADPQRASAEPPPLRSVTEVNALYKDREADGQNAGAASAPGVPPEKALSPEILRDLAAREKRNRQLAEEIAAGMARRMAQQTQGADQFRDHLSRSSGALEERTPWSPEYYQDSRLPPIRLPSSRVPGVHLPRHLHPGSGKNPKALGDGKASMESPVLGTEKSPTRGSLTQIVEGMIVREGESPDFGTGKTEAGQPTGGPSETGGPGALPPSQGENGPVLGTVSTVSPGKLPPEEGSGTALPEDGAGTVLSGDGAPGETPPDASGDSGELRSGALMRFVRTQFERLKAWLIPLSKEGEPPRSMGDASRARYLEQQRRAKEGPSEAPALGSGRETAGSAEALPEPGEPAERPAGVVLMGAPGDRDPEETHGGILSTEAPSRAGSGQGTGGEGTSGEGDGSDGQPPSAKDGAEEDREAGAATGRFLRKLWGKEGAAEPRPPVDPVLLGKAMYRIGIALVSVMLGLSLWLGREAYTLAGLQTWFQLEFTGRGIGDGYPLSIKGHTIEEQNFDHVGMDAVSLTNTALTGYNVSGKELYTLQHSFSTPEMKRAGTKLILFDVEGTGYFVAENGKKTLEGSISSGILTGGISQSGVFAIAREDGSYASSLVVYTAQGEEKYHYNLASQYITAVAVNPEGTHGVICSIGVREGMLRSAITVLDFNRESPLYEYAIDEDLLIDVMWGENDTVYVVGEYSFYAGDGGKDFSVYDYQGRWLTSYRLEGSRGVICLSDYEFAGESHLLSFHGTGAPLRIPLSGHGDSISGYGSALGVLYDGKLGLYDADSGALLGTLSGYHDVKSIAMASERSAYLLGIGSIRFGVLGYGQEAPENGTQPPE